MMLTRRRLLHFGTTAGAAVGFPVWLRSGAGVNTVGQGSAFTDGVPDAFPAQPAALAREIVSVSHFNPARVRELVEARPALARAAYDWGFGDWEDALGACSHTGQREIAEYLISKGARPTIFSAAMLGQLDVVKAFVAASPGVQRTSGPHSIRLLAHARAGGARAKGVLDYLEGLGDADARPTLTPLDEKTITLLSGTYTFGPGPTDRLEVGLIPTSPTAPPRVPGAELGILRTGGDRRQLFSVGNGAFFPAGAEAVRIIFATEEGSGRAMRLTVHDPGPVLTARKPL
jgi:hypothetical protein